MERKTALIICAALLTLLLVYGYYEYKFKHIKESKPIYLYETYYKVPNPVLVITDLKYEDSLIEYYEHLEKYGTERPFNFPLNALMTRTPCYLIEYTEDSMLIRFGCFTKASNNSETYKEGYAYYKTVHDTPPPNIGLYK